VFFGNLIANRTVLESDVREHMAQVPPSHVGILRIIVLQEQFKVTVPRTRPESRRHTVADPDKDELVR